MSRVLSLSALACGALLALTACSGGGEPAADTESTSAEPSSEATAPSGEASANASSEAGPGTYTNEELAAILTSVTSPDGSALTVVPADQLEPLMDQGMQALEGVTVTPAECNVFNGAAATPEGATYAVAVALSADGIPGTTVTLVSLDGAEDLMRDQAEESAALLEECSAYELELEGMTLTAETELVEASTDGAESQGARATISLPTGETLQTTSVSAARGNISVTAMNQQVGATAAPADGTLEQLVNEVLADADQG